MSLNRNARIIGAGVLLVVAIITSFLVPGKQKGDNPKKTSERTKAVIPVSVVSALMERDFDATLSDLELVVSGEDTFSVNLSIIPPLQKHLAMLMRRYRPRCGAAVVINPLSGEVYAAVSYKNEKELNHLPEVNNMLFWNEYPAASLFKIVTASGVFEHGLMSTNDGVNVSGNLWTLYKNQIKQDTPNRWSRIISMKEAFSRSINPFFGKVGIYILGKERMNETAANFLFNKAINFDLPLAVSKYQPPDDDYEAAQLASGFNRITTITPIHAALIAGAMANGGKVVNPWFIKSVWKGEKEIYAGRCDTVYSLVSEVAAKKTKGIMGEVVRSGTARKGFAHLGRDKHWRDIGLGGKTGTLSSANPRGRCDWFAGFAEDNGKAHSSIAVAVVTVHGQYWTVHSSYLAAEAIRVYHDYIAKSTKAEISVCKSTTEMYSKNM